MKKLLFCTFALLASLFAMAQSSQRPQYVVFQVMPKTATVTVDGTSVNTDSDGVAIFTLNDGIYNYAISSKNFRGDSGTFEVRGAKVFKSIQLSPAYGWLHVSSAEEFNGASIYIDNVLLGKLPVENTKLSSGTHAVRIVHEQYQELETTINITDGKTLKYTPTLTPRKGTLNITSSQAMANVFIDDKLVGQTPIMVDIIIGQHTVFVRKGSFGAAPQVVTVNENAVSDVHFAVNDSSFVETAMGLDMKMVYLRGGSFEMGSRGDYGVHTVTLDSYYIAECEVTQAQWQKIMGTSISEQRDKAGESSLRGNGDNYPMYYVSWEEAKQFCEKLSQLTGKKYALPTEAQWEYAARGGNFSCGTKYSGSDDIGKVAWYNGSSAHLVKQKTPNELGLYDMTGNVWEWCNDWYGSYPYDSQTNPTGPTSGRSRVLRGGGWYTGASVYYRGYEGPSDRSSGWGFRVVCLSAPTAQQQPAQESYKIGDVITVNGVKGVVFEVTEDGKHGKVISANQAPNEMPWSDAKTWCSNLGSGWYLPTKEELLLIYQNKSALNSTLATIGDEIYNGWHWSSTVFDSDCAWAVFMYDGYTYGTNKNLGSYVRAVSAF